MAIDEKAKSTKRFFSLTVLAAILLLAIIVIANLTELNAWIGGVLLLLRPVLIGLVLAYFCNPIFRLFEHKILFKLRPSGLRRALSLLCTYIVIIVIVALLLLLIIPQLITSITMFAGNYEGYIASAIAQINRMIASINQFAEGFTGNDMLLTYVDEQMWQDSLGAFGEKLLDMLSNLDIQPITEGVSQAISIVTDSIFGIFISIYLLSSKEKRHAQIMKLRHAIFSDRVNQKITRICSLADRSLGGFFEGKLLDALIMGVLCYITFVIFRMPYALLIAACIGVCNVIPIMGPFIGAIPSALIILLTEPAKVLPFLLIVFLLQQIDVNIICPKILGSNIGVSSLCVLIAISTMGVLWGFVGLLLGVPLFATVLELLDEATVRRLQIKGLPSGVENYYSEHAIVDPTKSSDAPIDKAAQRLERRALRAKRKQENRIRLSLSDKWALSVRNILTRLHLITEISDEGRVRFSAEEAYRTAAEESEALALAHQQHAEASADSADPTASAQ